MESSEEQSLLKAIGTAIKMKRVEAGLTQEALANGSGVARSFLSGVERGAKRATVTSLWKLALSMNCLPSEILSSAEGLLSKKG